MMKLEIWCGINKAVSFDPECLALCLLIYSNQLDIAIVETNSTLDGRLPSLVDGTQRVGGYIEIVNYLQQQQLLRPNDYDTCLQFYAEKLTTISLYLLFEIPANYEKITRPQISAAVPFPMQYNLTVDLQRQVQKRSASHGLKSASVKVDKQEGLNRTHEKMLEQSQNRKVALKATQRLSQVVAQAQVLYSQLEAIKLDEASPAYCLIAANLLIQTLALPQPVFKSTVQEYSSLTSMAEWARAQEPETTKNTTYTLPNYLKWKLNSFWA